jgi:hypothetical protein
MIHEDQIRPVPLFFEGLYVDVIPGPDIKAEAGVNKFYHPPVPGL